ENLTAPSGALTESFKRPQRRNFSERTFSWQGVAALFLLVMFVGVGGGVYFLRTTLLRLEALKVSQEQKVEASEISSSADLPTVAQNRDVDAQFLLNENLNELREESSEESYGLPEVSVDSSSLMAAALPTEISRRFQVVQLEETLASRDTSASYSLNLPSEVELPKSQNLEAASFDLNSSLRQGESENNTSAAARTISEIR
ncbi:MAG: hypothetical protein ACK5LK_05940, partial [Chthoniobacterales bacterium]